MICRIIRKRCRQVVGMGLVLAAAICCPTTAAFTTTICSARATQTLLPLNMVSSHSRRKAKSRVRQSQHRDVPPNLLALAPPRLSAEKQRELLLQAIEARRVKNLETELAMRKKCTPLLSIRSKEAGYGEDLEAYEDAIVYGDKARETLITTNMGLVHFCVTEIIGTKYNSRRALNSLCREDLVQEGAIGLARAIDRWNPAIGGKFSTYAVYWVRAAILRCIAEKDDLLRVPEHVSTAVRKVTKGAQTLGLELDSDNILSTVYANDCSWKEAKVAKTLAEEAGVTDKQLTEAMRIRNRRMTGGYVAFESWMQHGADLESDVSTLATREEPLREVEMEDLKQTLGRYLRPKEMEALCWRYGLLEESSSTATKNSKPASRQAKNYLAKAEEKLYGKPKPHKAPTMPVRGKWGEAMSFSEVGKKMEVSAEYGRRLCHGALKKLRQAADDGLLEPALLV